MVTTTITSTPIGMSRDASSNLSDDLNKLECVTMNGISHVKTDPSVLSFRTASMSLVVSFLKFLLLNGPLLVCWGLLLTASFVKEVWRGPLQDLLESFRLSYDESDINLGTYIARDYEQTYYYRRCDHRDISTHDANDLLIDPEMTSEERKEVIMTHGAVVMKDIISKETASELRAYLEKRHHEYHVNGLDLPWDELFWDGGNGNRLSLGLGPEDSPIVARAISEVGSNSELKRTLEATLGPDPGVVEVSTLSTMYGAEPQGIHTDSDFYSSSMMYTRSFLHSYTMFIALQDTTSRMGSTTLCPGTHWCADEDLADLCQCNFLDDDEDEEFPIGYCNTFEASSNGQTGLDVGVLQKGDAMMFNQNVWHRGPRNFDEDRAQNRVTFILTFVSRRDFEKGDNRQQGWGTYYYMRHSMWGHLFSDLKTAASGGMDLLKSRIWKAYGLLEASKRGNLPWLEHWARQQGNEMDFFSEDTLEDFQIMLRESKNPLVKWFFLDDAVLRHLFGGIASTDSLEDYERNLGWGEYIDLLIASSMYQSQRLYATMVVVTTLGNIVAYIVYCGFWYFSRKKGKTGRDIVTQPKPLRDALKGLGKQFMCHLCVFVMIAAFRHYTLFRAPLFRRIHDGDVHFKPIPPVPMQKYVEYEYDDNTGEIVSEHVLTEEIPSVDILLRKQEREQRDFRMRQPKHPYQDYYEEELARLEERFSRFHRRDLKEELLRPPTQRSAFPERMDVLIGSRFDARFLASMNYVLDFHPGNKEWIGVIREYICSIISQNDNESNAFLDVLANTIVSRVLDGWASSLATTDSVPRRFLKQDFETGWWVEMPRNDAASETKRSLLATAYPKSVGVLYNHWKEILSESRFGRYRETAMAKKWTAQRVERELQTLFQRFEDNKSFSMVTPMVSMPPMDPMISNADALLFPSTGRGLSPKSMVTGRTALSPSSSDFTENIGYPVFLSFRKHLKKLSGGIVTLKIDDHILYKIDGEPKEATIVEIFAEDGEIEIQPLRMDGEDDDGDDEKSLTRVVHYDDVQFYRPARENDLVWAFSDDDEDGETQSWKVYEVLYMSPFGYVDLQLVENYADNDYGDDVEHIKRITREVRDIYLTENHVPTIRLRQYD